MNNMRHGEGKIYMQTGVLIYEGCFMNDMQHGRGKLFGENWKKKYEGIF